MASIANETEGVTAWPGGIMQVKIPLPFSLKWVNSYLVPDEGGYTLIDPGLRTEESEAAWARTMEAIGIRFADIRQIVLTHQHPDHYGLAGWFQQRTGAPVRMSRQSHAYARRLWGDDRAFNGELIGLFARHGMPEPLREAVASHLESFAERVSPQPEVTYLEAGARLRMGGAEWVAIDAPGHARGQLCLYAEEAGWMICGDQVLPDITPNISVVPGEDADPLARFLDSLAELGAYEVKLAFPGHRDPFADFGGRIQAIAAHHERRLVRIEELAASGTQTGYAICEALFGPRIAGNAHNLRFAMAETLAHLVYLERSGRLVAAESAGGLRYLPV
ncbi:MBL fold metallo-hydrolase [Paenibacillus methanolicus]|uniref:Glyoxylase-like metal-dependent hydrolase (Beta-lactamase superfamily II) n=1 Tax=Paenibacillus methanolicus TaxID=582686 RepID=A0A5S5BVU1_9BACL|nr:MBL fold metallo-hydrolase [Paenibacillus methanolicus]TYP71147.1 glyoxylase-like metal-dependent hydrolase (beta-lactamase superfamily II) [Paenibacillus methanolicus]